jgi:flagellar protein FliJ
MFRFRLQNVLDFRERLKDEAEEVFRITQLEFNKEKQKLDELNQKRLSVNPNEDPYIGGMFLARLLVEIEKQAHQVTLVEQELNIARKKLVEASQKHEVILKLRNKKFEAYTFEEQREEQKKLDEFSIFKQR